MDLEKLFGDSRFNLKSQGEVIQLPQLNISIKPEGFLPQYL